MRQQQRRKIISVHWFNRKNRLNYSQLDCTRAQWHFFLGENRALEHHIISNTNRVVKEDVDIIGLRS